MRLYVVRHGIALSKTNPTCPEDAARPLTPEGIEKTTQVAEGLAGLHFRPSVLVSSPLLRAVQTAEIFAEALEFPLSRIRRTDSLMPESNPAEFLAELGKLRAREVMCFGHAPHLDKTIALATAGQSRVFTQLKKAGVALLEFESFSPPKALLCWLGAPKLLRRLAD